MYYNFKYKVILTVPSTIKQVKIVMILELILIFYVPGKH